MIIVITSIKLKSVWKFFALANSARKIVPQMESSAGFSVYDNFGFGRLHYTVSAWNSETEMKDFARSGAHLEAMKISGKIAEEIRTYSYEAEEMPSREDAKKLLAEEGKILKY